MKKGAAMNKRYFLLIAALLSLLLLAYGCGDDDDGIEQSAEQLFNQGLVKFDAGNYSGAGADFNAALGLDPEYYEAYFWLGWAELLQNNAGLAEHAFVSYLAEKAGSNDAMAGLALAYHAQDKFEEAIAEAEEVLGVDPTWNFSRVSGIDYLDLALVLAHSYYETGEFGQCLIVVQTYLNPSFNTDTGTPEGRRALADELERLYTG
jgi:tetratricopeptide (TPR) repeat protein